MVISPSLSERTLELQPRLQCPHASCVTLVVAHRKTLATLGTTTGEYGTAALGGHTGAEAVGLGALALIGLVGTLHGYYPPGAFRLLTDSQI